jgi:hypothetical protein
MKYGSEVIITANDTRLNKFECLQNNILRLITGTVKTTPVAALQLYTCNKPIVEEIKQQSALTYIKMKSLQDMNWINGTLEEEKLKTQKKPIKLNLKYLQSLEIPMQVESSPTLINPLDYYTYNIHLELIEEVNKK